MPAGMRTETVGFSMRPQWAHSIQALISAGTLSLIAAYGPRIWRRPSSRVCVDFHHEVSLTPLAKALVRVLAPVHMSKEKAGLLDNSVWHAVLAVKAVRAALCAVLRESATPSPDGGAAACHTGCPGNPAGARREHESRIPVCARRTRRARIGEK